MDVKYNVLKSVTEKIGAVLTRNSLNENNKEMLIVNIETVTKEIDEKTNDYFDGRKN